MRIIAGIARGQPLAVPAAGVRPTSDRVRGAIFSSLAGRVPEATVLDLFAGSGALGLEAASRGARSVVFVEQAAATVRILQENIDRFKRSREVQCDLSVIRADVLAELKSLVVAGTRFSLIFADPPYGDEAQTLLADDRLPHLLAADGILVLESAKRSALEIPALWKLSREAVYGDTRVGFLVSA